MIVELIVEDQYGPDGPPKGTRGVVVETRKHSEDGKYYAIYFDGFLTRGVFYAFEEMVEVIQK